MPTKSKFQTWTTIDILLCALLVFFNNPKAHSKAASELTTVRAHSCAIIEDYLGDVEVLNISQAHLSPVKMHGLIECGHSLTVGKGWMRLRLNHGMQLYLGEQSLVQFPLGSAESSFNEDQLIVLKGEIYLEGQSDLEELRVVSATARARLRQGKWVFSFNPTTQTTQLIALDGKGSFENRFDPTTVSSLSSGEFSELNFELLRMAPSLPSLASVASLKPKLLKLQVPSEVIRNTIQLLLKKQEKQTFTAIASNPKTHERKLASYGRLEDLKMGGKAHFSSQLKRKWLRSLTSGAKDAETFLFPKEHYQKAQTVELEIIDSAGFTQESKIENDLEKKRVIRALQAIHIP